MFTVAEVLGRIGILVGGPEKNLVRMPQIRKVTSFNHKLLHVAAPASCREYLTTYENLPVLPATTGHPKYLDLNTATMKKAKEIFSVVYFGENMAPYKYAGSLETLSSFGEYDEEAMFGRWWLHARGKDRILLYQGSEISGETSLAVGYVREFDSSNYDFSPGNTYVRNSAAEFDCPSELVELLILSSAKDLLTEAGNKQVEVAGLSQAIQSQLQMIQALDQTKAQALTVNDTMNKDIR